MDKRMDNGDAFLRAQRAAQQRAMNLYNNYAGRAGGWSSVYGYARYDPPIAGMPEPEDITGLKMLEEFLAKRRARK